MKTTTHRIECHPEGITLEAAMLRVEMTPDERADWDRARYVGSSGHRVCYPGDVFGATICRAFFPLYLPLPWRRWELEFVAPKAETVNEAETAKERA